MGQGISISAPRFGERSEPDRGAEMERRMISRLALVRRIWFGLGHTNTRFKF